MRGVSPSTSSASLVSVRSVSTEAGSLLPPTRLPWVGGGRGHLDDASRGTARSVSNGSLRLRRAITLANSGSATSVGSRRKVATATGFPSSMRVGSPPSGNGVTDTAQPSAAAASTISSTKQPSPIVIWRENGSVAGSCRSGST